MSSPRDIEASFGDRRPMRVRAWVRPRWLGAELRSLARTGKSPVVIELRLPEPGPLAVDRSWKHWHMVAGVPPPRASMRDPFSRLVDAAFRMMFEPDPERAAPSDRDKAIASKTMRSVYALVRELAIDAAHMCEPRLRSLSLRFPPCVRWEVYNMLASDPTGRLAQMVHTCPGLVAFIAAAHDEHGFDSLVTAALTNVQAGAPLPKLLASAVHRWDELGRRIKVEQEEHLGAWWRYDASGHEGRERARAQQRLLVRRAGPRVPPTLLLLPPPIAFAPEDIPRAVRDNTRWFRVMKICRSTMAPRFRAHEGPLVALSRFASRHALALHARRRTAGVRKLMLEVGDYVVAQRRHPSTKTDPGGLIDESRRWHREMHQAEIDIGTLGVALHRSSRLPDPFLPAWEDAPLRITPLRTVGEVIDEGKRLHHCVAARLPAVFARRSALYHVVVRDQHLTLELGRRPDGRLHVYEYKGDRNREPTRLERRLVNRWLAASRARPGEADEAAEDPPGPGLVAGHAG